MDKLLYKIYTYVVDTGSDAASRKMKLASSSPEHAYEQGRADVARVVTAIIRGAEDPGYLRDLCECRHAQLYHNAFGLSNCTESGCKCEHFSRSYRSMAAQAHEGSKT